MTLMTLFIAKVTYSNPSNILSFDIKAKKEKSNCPGPKTKLLLDQSVVCFSFSVYQNSETLTF